MQKVYLLLRSNKQTGPYSLEELLQLNLKPFDLVWMEGRSAAWQYPSEIPSLKPYVPETPHADAPFKPIATSVMEEKFAQSLGSESLSHPQDAVPQKAETLKRVFVSVPKTYASVNEQKTFASQNSYAEHKAFMPPVEEPVYEKKIEIKQTVPSYSQMSSFHNQKAVGEEEVHTNYSRSLHDVEEDYTNWVYKQKTKKKTSANPKDLVLVVLILAVIGGGYYVMSKPSVTNSVLPTGKVATQTIQQPVSGNSEETVAKEISSTEQKVADRINDVSSTNANTSINANSRTAKQAKIIKTKNPVIVSKSQTNSSVPSSQTSMPVEKTNPNIHNKNNDVVTNEPEPKQQSKSNIPEPKKKEKFGDLIKSIFSKKDRKDETKNEQVVLEDPKPATNRQATKRNEEESSSSNNSTSTETNAASLMEQVDITSNAPDNWMMGVKNLKITLRNRSNVTIQTASVLVSYYNENDDLVEKKLVYFSNVAPKSRAIATAPDSKFADHVDFKLASVSAKEDRYAKY